MQFSHRNGERKRPTIHGEFWFKGKRDSESVGIKVNVHPKGRMDGRTGVSSPYMGNWDDFDDIARYSGLWWGPIPDEVPPWEQDDLDATRNAVDKMLADVSAGLAEQLSRRLIIDGKPVYGWFTKAELEAAYGSLDELKRTIKEAGGYVIE